MQKSNLPPQDREQVVAYILQMSTGLAELARGQNLRFLAYLLEMVALAAATGGDGPAKVRLTDKTK